MPSQTTEGDWVSTMIPGDPLEIPSDAERHLANSTIAFWSEKWGETPFFIPAVYPDTTGEGFANTLAGTPTNRAFIRAQLRRWWRHPTGRRSGDP